MSGGVGGCRGAIPVTRPDQRASRGSRLKATSETTAFPGRVSSPRAPCPSVRAGKLSHYRNLLRCFLNPSAAVERGLDLIETGG